MRSGISTLLALAITLYFGQSTLAAPLQGAVSVKHTPVKSVKRSKHKYRYGCYFVPPPPAYMPSILPELGTHYSAPISQTSETRYSKYIYARQGYGDAAPVETRSGVTTWSWGKNNTKAQSL